MNENLRPESLLTSLLHAAGTGDTARVAAILDVNPELVNARGAIGDSGLRTALHFGSGHEAVVRLLLERGADPNIRDEGDNAYPLHFAAERGDLAIVKLLVEHGADPIGAGTTHELDAVGWAVGFDYAHKIEVAEYLLAHGARHSLVTAVAMGEVDAIRLRATAGADLDQRMDRTNRRRTPLHLAVVKKQPGALAVLLELGADPNLEDATGMTPLDLAAMAGDIVSSERLLAHGARMTLPAAVALGRIDEVERLVREHPEIVSMTSRERWGRLVVHASERASGRALDALLTTLTRLRGGLSVVNVEGDIDMAADGVSGYTPLHAAAFHGNRETVEVLLRHGADVRRRDGRWCATPAGWADYAGHHDVRDRILDADIDIFDAIDFDRADRVEALLDRDPEALARPFKAYASLPSKPDQWWPTPEMLPCEWAISRNKPKAAEILLERARRLAGDAAARVEKVNGFVRAACWDHHLHGRSVHRMHDRAAQRLVARDPWMAHESLETAIVCGEVDEVRRILTADPAAATRTTGVRGWSPILYLAYTRFTHPATIAHSAAVARLLLDKGADPNDFYMAMDAKYTVLTGIAGEGEQDAPRQSNAAELFDLLLERGAEPFDIQVLYNTHFSGDILWWLELVHKHTIGTRRAAWDDPDWHMLDMGAYGCGARFLIETAIKTRRPELAAWCLEHGANPNAAHARDLRCTRRSLYAFAKLEGQHEIAALLAEHGAATAESPLEAGEEFLEACLALDRARALRLLEANPEFRQSPHAMFEAARRDRPDALALLLDLGFPLEAADATGKRALHEAAVRNATAAARFLIERGAEVDPLESTYQSTPIGWATHSDHREMVELLGRTSRDVWRLTFNGLVDRLRDVLAEDPSRARVSQPDGSTPLWWLPDDDEKAMAILELLIAAGTDPSAKNREGRTAADAARRRGMFDLAARLETPVDGPGSDPAVPGV
jgi:ankyrin repeat protein